MRRGREKKGEKGVAGRGQRSEGDKWKGKVDGKGGKAKESKKGI